MEWSDRIVRVVRGLAIAAMVVAVLGAGAAAGLYFWLCSGNLHGLC